MFKDKIRKVDIICLAKFILCCIPAFFYKRTHDIWLVSERPLEARDNGYWFFKHICESNLHKDTYYIISPGADYEKVKSLGKIVQFGSLKHHFLYLAAKKHISSQVDGGMPNMRVCGFLERRGLLKNKKCFLQHGITKDAISFGFYSVSRVDLFVCAARPEYEFAKDTFGYPEGAVRELGFARFDNLFDTSSGKNQILVMPTWRAWLAKGESTNENEARKKFLNSNYYKKWSEIISSDKLSRLLEKQDCKLIFYPHSDMQPFVDMFESHSSRVCIADSERYDVQELLKSSSLMITDYSSVAFDFAYMEKPVIYYHFDYDEYRAGQHPEGYFSYERDGFGPVCTEMSELLLHLENILSAGRIDTLYKKRIEGFFDLRDRNNCQRIFEAVEKM